MEENMDKTMKSTQKILNKLIAEEQIAGDLYLGALRCAKPECVAKIQGKFTEIATDEHEDHMKGLVDFAFQNGFTAPFKYKDIEKYASNKMVVKFNGMKSGEDAAYYVQKGIESELEAIKSYEEALAGDFVMELQPLLLKYYYEELQHLEDL